MSATLDVAVHNSARSVSGACSSARSVFARLGWPMPQEYRVRHLSAYPEDSFTTVEFEGPVVQVTVYLPDLSDTEPEGRRSL